MPEQSHPDSLGAPTRGPWHGAAPIGAVLLPLAHSGKASVEWNRFSGEAVAAPARKVLRARLERAWSNLVCGRCPCPRQGGAMR